MKLYIVKYCANEYDDLGYDSPYPIYYSLSELNAKQFYENRKNECIRIFNDWIKNHPKLKHNEDYQIIENTNDNFEYSMGNWFYQYTYEERELEKDLRYG